MNPIITKVRARFRGPTNSLQKNLFSNQILFNIGEYAKILTGQKEQIISDFSEITSKHLDLKSRTKELNDKINSILSNI